MERRLYEAAITGNASQLLQLLQEDPDVLTRALSDCSGKNNPLHIGARWGHVYFVREILSRKPEFARELNSQGQSPLHLASAKGHVEVVTDLLKVNLDVCFVHDQDGRIPLHSAAVKGRIDVVKELYDAEPKAAWVLTEQGEPVLHLCVNHNQLETMKMLVKLVDDKEFVNMKDDDDNTVLHLLAAKDQYQVIKYLITNNIEVDVKALNVNAWTALDVAINISTGSDSWRIKGILKSVGAKTAKQILPNQPQKKAGKKLRQKYQTWLSEMKESLLVVATLMATVTYQAGMNPSGGVFQDDGYHNFTIDNGTESTTVAVHHAPGTAVMGYLNAYKYFTFFNTTGLFASLSLIVLLVSGLSFRRKISVWGLWIITWIAAASILGSYFCSFAVLTPMEVTNQAEYWLAAVPLSIFVWFVLICIVLGAHIFRWVRSLLYTLRIFHFFRRTMASVINKVRSLINLSNGRNIAVNESRIDANP